MHPNSTTQPSGYGYCECGCGQLTKLAPCSNAAKGWVKDEPKRFINGHNSRKYGPADNPNPSGLCLCGCGAPTPIASRTDISLGLVEGFPIRFLVGHWARTKPARPIDERFWEKVSKRGPDECWEWQASRNANGYGQFALGKRDSGSDVCAIASRVAWELSFGPIPPGVDVCHKCDNPPCCNPGHLFLGTQTDNTADMVNKGRMNKSNQTKGEAVHTARLSPDQVIEIRRLRDAGVSQRRVAKQFGVGQAAISNIALRKSWKHI